MKNTPRGLIDLLEPAALAAQRPGVDATGNRDGALVTGVEQILFVAYVIVKSALGYIEVLGDCIQRGAVESGFVEEPRAGPVERFLLLAVFFPAIETLRRGLVARGDGQRPGRVQPLVFAQAVQEHVPCGLGGARYVRALELMQPVKNPVRGADNRPRHRGGFAGAQLPNLQGVA